LSDRRAGVGSEVGSIRLEARLGAGGMGEVFLGYDPRLDRRVAVKTLHRDHRMSPQVKARFLREARLLSKLGHPAICQVYDLIETPEADYLVLEYVPGRTLKQFAERERPDLAARLRVAEKVATALAAAHREKIVHRDLKADNVMVTPEGEVKVLDFGIARSIDEPAVAFVPPPPLPDAGPAEDAENPEHPEDTGRGPEELPDTASFTAGLGGLGGLGWLPAAQPAFFTQADDHLTQQGTVVGTLQAMSPEQAAGAPLGEASDLYSFGILLQELVTGEPAYEPGGEIETLRRVLRAETRPAAGLEPDLARLIQDLQSLDPRRRPTAAETAARLRQVLDRPQRQRRRRLRLAAVAGTFALLLAVLATVSWLAFEAERSRREADRRRRQAEGLIGFMLGDLRQRLEDVNRLDLLDAVGDRALTYFAEVPEGQLTAAELASRADALRQIGEVRYSQGNLPAALAAFRRSQGLARDLVARGDEKGGERDAARAAGDAPHLLLIASSWVGQIHYDRGELDAALQVWSEVLQLARVERAKRARRPAPPGPSGSPGDLRWIGNEALAHHNVGTALEAQGDLAGALASYRRNLALQQEIARRRPGDAEVQAQVANTLAFVSVVLERQGDLAGALAERRAFLAIQERLVARDPENPLRLHELAVAQGFVGLLLAARGERAEARQLCERGFAIAAELARQDPGNALAQRWLGTYHSALGMLAAADGDAATALSRLRAAREVFEPLVARDPTNRDWRLQIGMVRGRTAAALEGIDLRRARAEASAATAILAPLIPEADDVTRGQIAEMTVLGGRLAAAAGDPTAARAAWQEALDLLASSKEPHWRVLAPRAEALAGLGRTAEARAEVEKLRRMGYRGAGFEELERALPPQPPKKPDRVRATSPRRLTSTSTSRQGSLSAAASGSGG
jgi:eukaryotic-like serine/threonine-protein kinase